MDNQSTLDFSDSESWVAGVDEVGRGPLAGPVVTAAVILDPEKPISGLADSKVLTEKKREALFDEIIEKSKAWAIGRAEVEEIDEINIQIEVEIKTAAPVAVRMKPEFRQPTEVDKVDKTVAVKISCDHRFRQDLKDLSATQIQYIQVS